MHPSLRPARPFLALSFLAITPLLLPAAEPRITDSLQPFVDNNILAGAVTLVAARDKVLSLEAVGYADVGAKTPMKTDDLFWIASMSKGMTAAAFMMLVDEGKVKLDDPVEKYLPEFKGQWLIAEQDDSHMLLKKPKHPITIREILSHTSGLPFASKLESPTLDGLPLRVAVGSYAMTPLDYEPDTNSSTPTPASTPPAASSKSSAECPTRTSCRSASSIRSA